MNLLSKTSVRLAVPAFHLQVPRFPERASKAKTLSQTEMISLFERELRGPIKDKFTHSEANEAERIRSVRNALYGNPAR